MSSKFKVGDPVRVTLNGIWFDLTGEVISVGRGEFAYGVTLVGDGGSVNFREHELTLADPDVHAVLDQMDAESAPVSKGMDEREIDGEVKCEGVAESAGVTAADKLRMIADTVDRQAPFGTELANFRRRLSAILSIGHDA